MSSRSSATRWILPTCGAVAVLLVLVAPIGMGSTAFARAAENALHAPLFALVAVALLMWLRQQNETGSFVRQSLCALVLAISLGAVGESVQSLTTTRHAEWIDLANDLLGAVAGLGLYAYYDQRLVTKWLRRMVCVVVLAVVAIVAAPVARLGFVYWQRWQQLPELVTWTSPIGHYFTVPGSADLRVVPLPHSSGGAAEIVLRVSPLRDSRWVGVTIEEPWPNWSSYSQLAVDVVNPNDASLELLLRINDRSHNNEFEDRFNRRFVIAPGQRATLTIPLAEVQAAPKSRPLDLENISRLVLFQDAERGASRFYVGRVRLVR